MYCGNISHFINDCSKKETIQTQWTLPSLALFLRGKKKVQIINASSESSTTFTSCWKSMIFIWQGLLPPPPSELWSQPRTNSVKSPAWDLQHLSSFCPHHVILWSPLTRREGEKFDLFRKWVLSTCHWSPWRKVGCLLFWFTHQNIYQLSGALYL